MLVDRGLRNDSLYVQVRGEPAACSWGPPPSGEKQPQELLVWSEPLTLLGAAETCGEHRASALRTLPWKTHGRHMAMPKGSAQSDGGDPTLPLASDGFLWKQNLVLSVEVQRMERCGGEMGACKVDAARSPEAGLTCPMPSAGLVGESVPCKQEGAFCFSVVTCS